MSLKKNFRIDNNTYITHKSVYLETVNNKISVAFFSSVGLFGYLFNYKEHRKFNFSTLTTFIQILNNPTSEHRHCSFRLGLSSNKIKVHFKTTKSYMPKIDNQSNLFQNRPKLNQCENQCV